MNGIFGTVDDASERMSGAVVSSSRTRSWHGVEVMRASLDFDEMEVPALGSHTLVLNLGLPYEVTGTWEGKTRTETFVSGGAKIVSAGLESDWRWKSENAPDMLHLSLDSRYVQAVAESVGAASGSFEVVSTLGIRDAGVRSVGLSLLSELDGDDFVGGNLLVESLANVFAINVLRNHSSLGLSDMRKVTRDLSGGLPGATLKRVLDFVGDNLAEPLTLTEIAEVARLSPYHFSRAFKVSTGLSPYRYVVRRRVEQARKMLLETELTMCEIAHRCGFYDQSHLARHFRNHLGMSPTELR